MIRQQQIPLYTSAVSQSAASSDRQTFARWSHEITLTGPPPAMLFSSHCTDRFLRCPAAIARAVIVVIHRKLPISGHLFEPRLPIRIVTQIIIDRRCIAAADSEPRRYFAHPAPSQTPTLNGIPTADPQVNFCVENPFDPAMRQQMLGSDA